MAADHNEAMSLIASTTPSTSGAPQGAVRLTDWGLITATGADAASFLHGQLTQDVIGLDERRARLAGYCSAKGRLLASFVAWRSSPEQILLACSADLLAPTLKRLSMYVLRAKCKMADASADMALYGLAGASAAEWLVADATVSVWSVSRRGDAHLIRLPDAAGTARWLLVQPATAAAPELPALDADTWRWLEVRSGVARIVAATSEQFVPQMVNLELVGGVNFQKGCYPGQEIVARSQYRGTLKRRMQLLDASGPVAPGQDVIHSADPGQPAGMVVLAAPGPDGRWSALAELKLGALGEPGELRSGDALLSPRVLPYAIPAEAT
jgi:tRNA-modifying protein YgfZ